MKNFFYRRRAVGDGAGKAAMRSQKFSIELYGAQSAAANGHFGHGGSGTISLRTRKSIATSARYKIPVAVAIGVLCNTSS